MASKTKANGIHAAQAVERARKREGCSVTDFFRKAGIKGVELGEHVRKYALLLNQGAAAVPGYSIPRAVLDKARQH